MAAISVLTEEFEVVSNMVVNDELHEGRWIDFTKIGRIVFKGD